MKISSMQEYGLRCILQLAAHGVETPLTVREIAKQERLTTIYVAKLLNALRRGGLVRSVRGLRGGYVLARSPESISVSQTLEVLGWVGLEKNLCKRFKGTGKECTHFSDCGIRPVWTTLGHYIHDFLEGISLRQLMSNESVVHKQLAITMDDTDSSPIGTAFQNSAVNGGRS